MDKAAVKTIKIEIITKALEHVPFDGWSWEVVEGAASECGYQPAMARAVFPSLMTDVLDGFADLADQSMLAELETINPDDLRIRDRVRTGVLKRLECLADHKEALRQSLAFWLMPLRKPRAAKIVWRTADRIWVWAGDTSADYNFYTKRTLLSGVLVSTTLAWLNDDDPQMAKTQKFLDNRIENVMQFGQLVGKIKKARGRKYD